MMIGYIISRFPKISETFILNEMLALRKLDLEIELYPLIHEKEPCRHPGVEAMLPHTRYLKLLSTSLLGAHVACLARQPRRYLATWGLILRGYARSPKRLPNAIVVMLKSIAMASQIRQQGINRIHTHWATYPALCAWVIKRLHGIPYSFTTHAHDIFVDRTMLREKMEEAEFVVTISDYNRQFLIRQIGETAAAKVRVIRLGVDLERFASPACDKAALPPFRMVCVATLKDYKGHAHLLDACAILRKQGVPFVCECIGDGDLRPQIERRIAELGLTGHVHLLGFQTADKVLRHLAAAHCMVLPSIITGRGKMEGIPVAIMEAMAMRLPIVASAISGIPEIVANGVNGILVEPGNAGELAAALQNIYRNPEMALAMGEAGRQTVARDYDLARNIRRLHKCLVST